MKAGPAADALDPDEPLVARYLAGDTSAFDTLFARHQDYVYNIVFGILGRADDARDVTQDVFVVVHRRIRSFRRGSRFATWLYRIAINRAVDSARSRQRLRWLPIVEAAHDRVDDSPGPEELAEASAQRDNVQAIMNEVPLRHRDVLVLRYYQDLTIEEIAEVLGVSTTAAKVRLHRARRHFKERYIATFGDQS